MTRRFLRFASLILGDAKKIISRKALLAKALHSRAAFLPEGISHSARSLLNVRATCRRECSCDMDNVLARGDSDAFFWCETLTCPQRS
jgi:hypothetical protein